MKSFDLTVTPAEDWADEFVAHLETLGLALEGQTVKAAQPGGEVTDEGMAQVLNWLEANKAE